MNGTAWTPEDIRLLRELYPDMSTAKVALRINRSVSATYAAANNFGICKSPAYMDSPEAYRLRRGDNIGAAYRFKPGHLPANAGTRRPGWAPGRMSETQFKPGCRTGIANENWKPIGTIRPDPDGYLRIKVREGTKGEPYGFGNTKIWPLLHRHVWEQHHGPVPTGYSVTFRDGDRSHCEIGNLQLLSRQESMARNSVHNLPEELQAVIQLNGALKRKIRRVCEKQNAGSA